MIYRISNLMNSHNMNIQNDFQSRKSYKRSERLVLKKADIFIEHEKVISMALLAQEPQLTMI